MASAADQTLLVYTRLAQLAFTYIDAVRSGDWARSSTALSVFQQGFAARRATVEAGWVASGNTLTPTLSAAIGRVGGSGVYDQPTSIALAMVLMGAMGGSHRAALSIPSTLPEMMSWASGFFTYVTRDPSLQWLMEMAIDTSGVGIAQYPTTLAAYLQRPLSSRVAPAIPPAPTAPPVPSPGGPMVMPVPTPSGSGPRSYTAPEELITGGRSKVSPWVIAAMVAGVVGAGIYLLSGVVARKSSRSRR